MTAETWRLVGVLLRFRDHGYWRRFWDTGAYQHGGPTGPRSHSFTHSLTPLGENIPSRAGGLSRHAHGGTYMFVGMIEGIGESTIGIL